MVRKLWKSKYAFIDPGAIMGVVVALIILAVGVFAFFITIESISTAINNESKEEIEQAFGNISDVGNSVFNIIGIVLIIGAIMVVVGMVYNLISVSDHDSYTSNRKKSNRQRSSQSYNDYCKRQQIERITRTRREIDKIATPNEIGDYELSSIDSFDRVSEKSNDYKTNGHWVKLKKLDKESYGLYVSKWTKDFTKEYGKPKFE